jgi:hypothetical protein
MLSLTGFMPCTIMPATENVARKPKNFYCHRGSDGAISWNDTSISIFLNVVQLPLCKSAIWVVHSTESHSEQYFVTRPPLPPNFQFMREATHFIQFYRISSVHELRQGRGLVIVLSLQNLFLFSVGFQSRGCDSSVA